jgi:hypothetical protein
MTFRMPADDVPELDEEAEEKLRNQLERQRRLNSMFLYNADPSCQHHVISQWSGVKCTKCPGWYCT